jgi:hypothetical protein
MKPRIANLIITVLIVALLFATGTCVNANRKTATTALALADTVSHYTNALGTQTASIRTLQTDKTQLQQLVLNKDRELATLAKSFTNLHSVTKYKTITVIDTITIHYRDSIPCVFKRQGLVKNNWYSFTYTSNQNGVRIDSLRLPNSTSVIIGTKRKWFLGKEMLTTEITHTNPYVTTPQLTSAEMLHPTPLYKKWYIWLGIGLAGGVLLAK